MNTRRKTALDILLDGCRLLPADKRADYLLMATKVLLPLSRSAKDAQVQEAVRLALERCGMRVEAGL